MDDTFYEFPNSLICAPFRCLYQSIHNKTILQKSGKNLHLKCGGLAIDLDSKLKWVYAVNGYSIAGIKENGDYHFWLEDDDGKIYDFITPILVDYINTMILKGHTSTFAFSSFHYFNGETKNNLLSKGIFYIESKNLIVKEARSFVLLSNSTNQKDCMKSIL